MDRLDRLEKGLDALLARLARLSEENARLRARLAEAESLDVRLKDIEAGRLAALARVDAMLARIEAVQGESAQAEAEAGAA